MAQTKPFRPCPPGYSNCFGNYQCVILSLTFHRVRADQISLLLCQSFLYLLSYFVTVLQWVLTSANLSSEPEAGEVVTLAVRPIYATKIGWVAHTLSAETLALAAAHLRTFMFPATHKLTLNYVCVPRRKYSVILVLTCSHWLGLGPLCTHTSAPQSPGHTHRLRTPAPLALGCSRCCSPREFDGSHTHTGTPVRSPGYLGNLPAARKTAVGQQDSLLTRP